MKTDTLEAAYLLSPMQRGMLFHYVHDPASLTYCVQMCHRITGEFDASVLRRAWQYLIDRHTALRTAFLWKEVDQPIQAVLGRVAAPWHEYDWRSLSDGERQARVGAFLAEDRAQGFDLSSAPLMRMTLIRLRDDEHQFVWSFHHLLLDGWSHTLLNRELAHVFRALRAGVEPTLPPARPYQDHIAWLQRQDVDAPARFWRTVLDGFRLPSTLKLAPPADRRADAERQGHILRRLPAALAAGVTQFAQRHDLTPNTVVLGAWALTIGAYSCENDVLFGSIVSGRPADLLGVEQMVGLFINVVPVRARIEPARHTVEWLRALQRQQAGAREFEYCALADIQSWSDAEPGAPLFDTVLSFENFDERPQRHSPPGEGGRGIDVRALPVWESATNHAIVLKIDLHGGQLAALYDRARLGQGGVERILDHLQRALEVLPAKGESPLGSLAASDGLEPLPRRAVTAAADLPDGGVHHLISARARCQPNAVAVVHGDAQLTYASLERRANQWARYLRRRDAEPRDIVAICSRRSTEMVAALLGVLKAGCVFLPIDAEYPDERIAYMLGDSDPCVVLTTLDLEERLSALGARCLPIDGSMPAVDGERDDEIDTAGPADASHIIYTSGSTGRPKGVIGLHAGLVNRLLWIGCAYPFADGETVLAKTTLSFVDGVTELLTPLVHGATVVLADADVARDPSALASAIARSGVSRITVVPSLLKVMLDEALAPALRSCRLWVSSGEALPPALAARFGALLPSARLLNLYGASEASGDSLYADCSAGREVTLGVPIANTSAHVLDRTLEPVPHGVPGELYVGGVGLARGYLGRPELTAAAFIPDRFSETPGARLYRTGDLVRRREDGQIEFVGRADHQIKIRGHRVELREIESVLREHPGVRDAAVVVAAGEERGLVAYVVCRDMAARPGTGDLHAHLEHRLPGYMVPAAIELLEALPLTASGKVDRAALATRERAATDGNAYQPPAGDTERTLATLVGEVLKVKRVSATASFVRLGGDSLQAIRLSARARQAGIALTAKDILELRTVRAWARAIEAEAAGPETSPSPRRSTWCRSMSPRVSG